MGSGYLLVRTEVNKTTGAVVMQESEVAVFVSTSSDKDFFKSCASAAQANIESFEMPKPKDDPSKRRNGGG
ncbi:hypothetical protein [Deefgea sp. CFH1-16]|uniref:hypothetical protein n=1 Tax=Deefgea sp. CFH1-16 TaxID=2675457 RepID=UPI0015F77D67|nr:hypothetical protein [Deefgea sp. CFH1-16]MBM5575394.1 hypothetical protein [Deefgea sp. CFH1-16]